MAVLGKKPLTAVTISLVCIVILFFGLSFLRNHESPEGWKTEKSEDDYKPSIIQDGVSPEGVVVTIYSRIGGTDIGPQKEVPYDVEVKFPTSTTKVVNPTFALIKVLKGNEKLLDEFDLEFVSRTETTLKFKRRISAPSVAGSYKVKAEMVYYVYGSALSPSSNKPTITRFSSREILLNVKGR